VARWRAAEYAQALDQEELKLLGAWYNRATGRYEPPTKSTIHRVVMATDAEALEELQQRYATARVAAPEEPGQRETLASPRRCFRSAPPHGRRLARSDCPPSGCTCFNPRLRTGGDLKVHRITGQLARKANQRERRGVEFVVIYIW